MPIDPEGSRSLAAQIADDLRRRIATGEWPVGKKIPSLRDLASTYDVAQLTVHTAVRVLQQDGVLVSTSGRGTFVSQVPAMPDGRSRNAAEHETSELEASLAAVRDEVRDLRQRLEAVERTLAEQ
jgi:GntR family transcriptional regulator